jgi:hypothetical protein
VRCRQILYLVINAKKLISGQLTCPKNRIRNRVIGSCFYYTVVRYESKEIFKRFNNGFGGLIDKEVFRRKGSKKGVSERHIARPERISG